MIQYIFGDITQCEDGIKQLFNKKPFGRFLSDAKLNKTEAVEYEWNRLKTYVINGNIALAIKDNSKIVGLLGFRFSEWDTEVFQIRLAFIDYFIVEENNVVLEREISTNLLIAFHEWVKNNRIKVVVSKLDSQYFSPIITLQQNGYRFFECITYRSLYNLDSYKLIGQGIKFRYADENDKSRLKQISLDNTYNNSHFYLDTNFKTERVNLLYAKWIETALESRQKVIVLEEDNAIAGAFIYEIVDYSTVFGKKFGVWKSVFVDKKYRGLGIGFKLFRATLNSCINEGVDIIDTSLVAKNIISQRIHDRLGFSLVCTQYTFHKWF